MLIKLSENVIDYLNDITILKQIIPFQLLNCQINNHCTEVWITNVVDGPPNKQDLKKI